MDTPADIITARINPHIIGRYLAMELKELKKLAKSHQLLKTQDLLSLKTIEDVCTFSREIKKLNSSINHKLNTYKKFFASNEPLSLDEVIDYFNEQLAALNKKEMIDRIVVELAYAAYKLAEKNGLTDTRTMGKPLFEEIVYTDGQEKEPLLHASDDASRSKPPPVVSSTNLAVPSMNPNATPFSPSARKQTQQPNLAVESITESRLYRFWMPNLNDTSVQGAHKAPLSLNNDVNAYPG